VTVVLFKSLLYLDTLRRSCGIFVRHHFALELVCGADFSRTLMWEAGPGDLGGSRGSDSAENPRKTGPKMSSQIAFRCPATGPAGASDSHQQRPLRDLARADHPAAPNSLDGAYSGASGCVCFQRVGYLKAVWLEMFGSVFLGFPAEAAPRDPPRSPGPAPHINLHDKSALQTNSKAKW